MTTLLKQITPVLTPKLIGWLCLLLFAFSPSSGLAEELAQPDTKTFPGFNEVVPKATAIAAGITDATTQVQQAAQLEDVYVKLDEKVEVLKKLEEQYSSWDDVNTWPFNRLLNARINYNDLIGQKNKPLEEINTHFKNLEKLRIQWDEEKTYWQEWQAFLRKADVKLPRETFTQTLGDIDKLLQQITQVGNKLLKAQQKYSPVQELVASRLNLLDRTMDSLRLDSFRRNTYSLFETDYYRQFNQELFTRFAGELASNIRLPNKFFERHALTLALQFISTIIILLLLVYRKKQSKALTEEWSFLYRHPLAGAVFITLAFMGIWGNPYTNAPLVWMLLSGGIMIIAAVRLLDAIYPQQLTRRVIRVIATLFIITKTLQVFGLPTPLLQIFQVLLCAIVVTACWQLIRKHQNEEEQLWFGIYLGGSVAAIGLITATFGFATLTTNLIDATLSSFIAIIMLKMVLRLAEGGIHAFMTLTWVKSRRFMQTLGVEEATQKLQSLMRIIVLINTGLYFLVIWKIFDSMTDAREAFLDYQYSFGEFTLSVKMVVMVIAVLYLTSLISWVIQAFVESQVMTPRKMDIGVKESLKRLTHYGLFTIGFLIAVGMAGLDLQKFTIIAGALGVGIGFGMQNIVNNFVSGLILLFERPVKVGDTITLGEEWGVISRIGLRSTIVETFDRSEIIVPNADLISQKVTNWTFSSKIVRVTLPVGVAYGSSLEKVLQVLNKAAKEHPDVLSYPEPNTIFEGFGNSSIDFTLRFWVHTIDDRLKVRSDVGVIVDRKFREEGITIPFPQQDLHLRSVDSVLQTLFEGQPPKAATENDNERAPE